eukprot:330296-Amphidinium_carterae.1
MIYSCNGKSEIPFWGTSGGFHVFAYSPRLGQEWQINIALWVDRLCGNIRGFPAKKRQVLSHCTFRPYPDTHI